MSLERRFHITWPVLIGLALAFLPLILMPVLLSHLWFSNSSDQSRSCAQVEWVMQNAANCLAHPHHWQQWDEIDTTYGKQKSSLTCPQFVDSAQQIQGELPLLAPIIEYLQSHSEDGFNDAVRAVYKTNFCSLAGKMGWTSHD